MKCLTPHLDLIAGESATSFASRLTFYHTGQVGLRVLSDCGIDQTRFLRGEPESVTALAEVSGVSPTALMDASIRRHAAHRQFGGERLSRAFIRPDGARFCPVCLVEDGNGGGQRHARLNWRFRAVRVCMRHGLVLASGQGEGRGDHPLAFPTATDLQQQANTAKILQVTAFDQWVVDRLGDASIGEGEFLARQTLEQGVRVCEMLGATLEYGLDVAASKLCEEKLASAASQAFEIVRQGESAVWDALDHLRAMSKTNAGQAKFRAFYGNFYEWVRSTGGDIGPGPIRDILREHIKAHTALGFGDHVLGDVIEKRTMHSAYSLSRATGLHPKRLRKILVRLGIAQDDCDDLDYNLLVFPVGATEQLCINLNEAVSLSRLPQVLGCSRTQAECLFHAGIIRPVVEAGAGIGRADFARSEIKGVLDWIGTLSVWPSAQGVDMTRAAKMTSLSTAELLRRGNDGHLELGRIAGSPSIANIRVSLAGIRSLQVKTRGLLAPV